MLSEGKVARHELTTTDILFLLYFIFMSWIIGSRGIGNRFFRPWSIRVIPILRPKTDFLRTWIIFENKNRGELRRILPYLMLIS
nr:MAG TPA: hypothetical protein [Caudoviricetes sp.]